MPSLEELGCHFKTEHPGKYDDMSNAEVGRRMKAKNPDKYSAFTEDLQVKTSSPVTQPNEKRPVRRIRSAVAANVESILASTPKNETVEQHIQQLMNTSPYAV